jgi:hypothetical protein
LGVLILKTLRRGYYTAFYERLLDYSHDMAALTKHISLTTSSLDMSENSTISYTECNCEEQCRALVALDSSPLIILRILSLACRWSRSITVPAFGPACCLAARFNTLAQISSRQPRIIQFLAQVNIHPRRITCILKLCQYDTRKENTKPGRACALRNVFND